MTRKAKKWLSALAAGLIALTIGVTQYDLDSGWAALSGRLSDRFQAMFVDVAGFQKTGLRVTFATESSARLPNRLNDRWMQAFASCGSGQTCLRIVPVSGGFAPADAQFVTLALDATLTGERVLTGTTDQIIVTDGGANTTVTLSTPQDIATTSSPTFLALKLEAATNQILLDSDAVNTGQITMEALSAVRTYTFPDASGEISLLGQTIDLTTEVTGTLPVGNGGMGATSHIDGAILLGNAAGAITNLGVLADDTLVLGDGVTDPGTALVPDCDATDEALNYDVTTNAFSCQTIVGSAGAPTGASYVVLGLDATLSAERVLTGTANQIILVDGGVNTTITLSTPQDIAAVSSPTFAALSLNNATNQIILDADEGSGFTGTITLAALSAARIYTFPNVSGEISLLGQAIDLASEVTGTLPVGNGGTGATSHTDGAILLGNAAGAITNLGVLADDTLVLGDGVTDPGTATVPNCVATDSALNYTAATNTFSCQASIGGGAGAPDNAQYVTLALDATLTAERVLTGTADQITITDGGANSTVTLSLPQDIALTSSPTFASLSLNDAVNQIILDADEGSGFTGTITLAALSAARTYTFPNAGGEVSLLGQTIDLASGEVTGTLPVGNGGMGATSHTDGAILLGSGASAISNLGVLADDTLVLGDGVTAPGTATVPDCDATDSALNYDVTTNAFSCQTVAASAAPDSAQYVTLALDAALSAERVLTGTTDQIIITDGGANTTVTLSLPQDIALTSSPTFVNVNIDNRLSHTSDTDTHIDLNTDEIEIEAGSVLFIKISEAAVDVLDINPNGLDIDLIVQTATVVDAFTLDGGADTAAFNVPLTINNLLFETDNTNDIGGSVTTFRPRNIFAGTLLSSPTLNLTATTNQIVLDSDAANTGTLTMEALTGSRTFTLPDGSITLAGLELAQEYTSQQNFNATVLTDAANISWNLATNQVASVVLGGNRTLDNPTNQVDGATYILIIKQDGTPPRTLAYGTAYKFPGGTAPTLSTGANDVDIITFISDGTNMFGVIVQDFS